MDRSFLAFRQFLHRFISGIEDPQRDGKLAAPPRSAASSDQEADVPDDWVRLEL